jgi:hypothetical protein
MYVWEASIVHPGPIFTRELFVAARRPAVYRKRVMVAFLLLLIMGGNLVYVAIMASGNVTSRNMESCARRTLIMLAVGHCLLILMLVPGQVALLIAQERERRSLDCLLTTCLSSTQIILGKLLAGLIQSASWLVAGLPIMLLLPLLGGLDPLLVALMYAGMISSALTLGALAVLASLDAREVRSAVGQAVALGTAWWIFPPVAAILGPRVWPWLGPWIWAMNAWVLASSPTGLLTSQIGLNPSASLIKQLGWMIGLQIAVAPLLLLWAILRFRSVCRRVEERSAGPAFWRRLRQSHWRLFRRPDVSDDPMLWKELHTSSRGSLARCIEGCVYFVITGLFIVMVYYIAAPAAHEVLEYGYGSRGVDVARLGFNGFMRATSTALFIALIALSGTIAESLAGERARDTWISLIATPLEGWEVLRAKRLGVLWKMRLLFAAIVFLWTVGLLVGSLHPAGYVTALVALGVWSWFSTALGSYYTVVLPDREHAASATIGITLLLILSAGLCFVPALKSWPILAAGSLPFLTWLSLVSYSDVREAVTLGTMHFNHMRFPNEVRPLSLLVALAVSLSGLSVAAYFLIKTASRVFDRAIGRPTRAKTHPASSPAPPPRLDMRNDRARVNPRSCPSA